MPRSLQEVLKSVSDVLVPEELGEAAVTISSRAPDGDTALHVMAWRKDTEGARLLLEAGADVNAVGDMSETPLHVALRQSDAELVELLLSAGAQTNLKSEFGLTPLEQAERAGGVLQQLVRKHVRT